KHRLFDGSDVSLRDIKVNAIDLNNGQKTVPFDRICNVFGAIGIGLYPQYSLLGHSCQPNCAFIPIISKGLTTQLRAMRPIVVGEEITISLVGLSKSRADRREELKFWSIVCECDKCVHHLDRGLDYFAKFALPFPSHVFAFDTRLMDYLREVLTDLNATFGEYNPQKTMFLLKIVFELMNCPLIPEPVMNEMKADLLKAI
ncbi:unnamed protein product, partial [Medioppia subpectinata]